MIPPAAPISSRPSRVARRIWTGWAFVTVGMFGAIGLLTAGLLANAFTWRVVVAALAMLWPTAVGLVLILSAEIRSHGARFDTVEARVDKVDSKVDAVDGRVDTVEGRMDDMEAQQRRLLTFLASRHAHAKGFVEAMTTVDGEPVGGMDFLREKSGEWPTLA